MSVEVTPSTTGRGASREVVGWFARVTYTGDPVREFRGTRSDLDFFETEVEALTAAKAFGVPVTVHPA